MWLLSCFWNRCSRLSRLRDWKHIYFVSNVGWESIKTKKIKWKHPYTGRLKLNVDASIYACSNSFFIDMILCDHNGSFFKGKAIKFPWMYIVWSWSSGSLWNFAWGGVDYFTASYRRDGFSLDGIGSIDKLKISTWGWLNSGSLSGHSFK